MSSSQGRRGERPQIRTPRRVNEPYPSAAEVARASLANAGPDGPELCPPPQPVTRRLRGYAFDPSLSTQLDTAVINETIYHVRWESPPDPGKESRRKGYPHATPAPSKEEILEWDETVKGLRPGPIGEYIEVIDFDPATGVFYRPVDLHDPRLLAQDGLPPSEGNPQFHQQFVYAVAMTTIANFEKALGRLALWSSRDTKDCDGSARERYVQRLRIYPHALREANAYYSPAKKALLFGYFPASRAHPERFLPGSTVFTCLSHDIIAHETTHALLDGMHRRFIEATHPDGLAFHEAFADIVALFQRFSFPDVLEHQIRRTRGDLSAPNLLGELAQQFGEAIGKYGALRSAIGEFDENRNWKPLKPDPKDYSTTTEPHARGAILVAAIFDAFLSIYRMRVADLMRIASSGTGILPAGELHPDLVRRLADEASKVARQILNVCIRALDYCPPVDITFGDYLRAIITADAALVKDDKWGYRIAFIEAFRRRGIYPPDVRTLSVESLVWKTSDKVETFFEPLRQHFFRETAFDIAYLENRFELFRKMESYCARVHDWIVAEGYPLLKEFSREAGLTFEFGADGLRRSQKTPNVPTFQVHSIRIARRVGPDGNTLNQIVLTIIQTRDVLLDPKAGPAGERFEFRGGCTLIIDLDTRELSYLIAKKVTDEARVERQRAFRRSLAADGSLQGLYFKHIASDAEPFALLHGDDDMWEEEGP